MKWNKTVNKVPKKDGSYLVAIKDYDKNHFSYNVYRFRLGINYSVWSDDTGHECYAPEYWTSDIESPE